MISFLNAGIRKNLKLRRDLLIIVTVCKKILQKILSNERGVCVFLLIHRVVEVGDLKVIARRRRDTSFSKRRIDMGDTFQEAAYG